MAEEQVGHKQTSDRVEFCRAPNCDQTDYGKVRRAVTWRSEAHHILCVNEVNIAVGTVAPQVKKVIDASNWCVNKDGNMLALPLWGTTVMYYSDNLLGINSGDMAGLMKGIAGSLLKKKTDAAPDFANWPQHNYAHSGKSAASSYNLEMQTKLKDVFTDIQVQMEEHAITGEAVGGALDGLAGDMRGILRGRGNRVGSKSGKTGTHEAWLDPSDTWYIPFAMADAPKPLPFAKMTAKIRKIAEAFWKS